MAYTVTYSSLVAELQDIVEDTGVEFQANLPKIIDRAQDVVQRDLGLSIWRTLVNTHLNFNDAKFTRQPSWLHVLSFFLPDQMIWPEQRSFDWVRAFGPAKGRPRYWCERDDGTFLFAPIPDQNYNVTVEAYTKLPSLSSTNQTNWITDNAADLLLLASLIGCEMYLVSPERVKEFQEMYQIMLDGALRELRQSERTRYAPVRAAPKPTLQVGATA